MQFVMSGSFAAIDELKTFLFAMIEGGQTEHLALIEQAAGIVIARPAKRQAEVMQRLSRLRIRDRRWFLEGLVAGEEQQ